MPAAPADSQDQDPAFVHNVFSQIAKRYVLMNHVMTGGIDILWRKKVVAHLQSRGPSNQRILDVATGTGDLAIEIQNQMPEAEVIGVDFCEPMLEKAKERGLRKAMVANGMALPFPDCHFDALTISYGLRNMEDWDGALREFGRVLKKDGILIILDCSLPENKGIRALYRVYLHWVLPVMGRVLTGCRDAYQYLGASVETFPSGSAMLTRLKEAGYADPQQTPLLFGVSSIYLGIHKKRPSQDLSAE